MAIAAKEEKGRIWARVLHSPVETRCKELDNPRGLDGGWNTLAHRNTDDTGCLRRLYCGTIRSPYPTTYWPTVSGALVSSIDRAGPSPVGSSDIVAAFHLYSEVAILTRLFEDISPLAIR
jgi:hypothetical protein